MQFQPRYKCYSEIKRPNILLVHEPGEETRLAVEHSVNWGFDPSLAEDPRSFERWLEDAQNEHRGMVKTLNDEGIQTLYVTDLLRERINDCRLYLQKEFERVKSEINKFEAKVQYAIQSTYEEGMSNPVSFLLLGLEISESFRSLPYSTKLQVYRKLKTLMPQTQLYYVQDGVISTPAGLVKSKMSMWDRVQEPDILEIALGEENYVYRINHRTEGGDVTIDSQKSLHGEDVLYVDGRMLLGINDIGGVGILKELKILSEASHVTNVVPLFLPDIFDLKLKYATGNVMHTDTILMPLEKGCLLANIEMLRKTGVVEDKSLVNGYEWAKRNFEKIVEVPDEEQQGTCGWGSNALPLGNGKVLSSIHLKRTNRNLKASGFDVISAPSATLTQGYGSLHCMTAYLG